MDSLQTTQVCELSQRWMMMSDVFHYVNFNVSVTQVVAGSMPEKLSHFQDFCLNLKLFIMILTQEICFQIQ